MCIKFLLPLLLFLGSYFSNAQSLEQKVDDYLQPLVEATDFYGSVLFAKNGEIEMAKGYGFADLEHGVENTVESVYHMGSLNKPLTALGVMILHQRGKINIDHTIAQYIDDYPRGDEITVKNLLAQTSGIPSYNRFSDYGIYAKRENSLAEVVDWFKSEELLFAPGSKYGYSNSNYVLLAYLIELVSSQSYEVYMRENVFLPLQMENTGMYKYDEIVKNRAIGYDPANNAYDLKPVGFYNNSIKVGSGAVHSTVLDMLKLEKAIYSDKLLTEETRNLMLTEVDENEYGLGWGIWPRFEKRKYDHDGASPGSVAYFSTYPDDKVTIIFLGNINSGVFHRMKYDLAAIYFDKAYDLPEKRKYIELEESALEKFTGRYEFENGKFFDLKVMDGDLRFLWRGRGDVGYLLSPLDNSSFYMRARGDQIDFKIVDGEWQASYIERSGVSILKKIATE
ncbi:MAG: serine hydrolase domain-containing protein [Bacteroidota bacterium]